MFDLISFIIGILHRLIELVFIMPILQCLDCTRIHILDNGLYNKLLTLDCICLESELGPRKMGGGAEGKCEGWGMSERARWKGDQEGGRRSGWDWAREAGGGGLDEEELRMGMGGTGTGKSCGVIPSAAG